MDLPEENLALCRMFDIRVEPFRNVATWSTAFDSWRLSTPDGKLWVLLSGTSLARWQVAIEALLRFSIERPNACGQIT